MLLKPNEIHVWTVNLTLTPEQEGTLWLWLSEDEKVRAQRFHFPIHRRRFIAARATLRYILSLYLSLAPERIVFAYNEHKKPSLHTHALQFNLSHSHDMAIIGISLEHAIGIDIEKIEVDNKLDLAQRFFSLQEVAALLALPHPERTPAFYRIWSRKEALIKAVGKGLIIPLDQFSVSANDTPETIAWDNQNWFLRSLPIHHDYSAAIASQKNIDKIKFWSLINQKPKLDNESDFCEL